MADIADLTVAVRPRGTHTWVPIDIDTPYGRKIAAKFGFTPNPQKEEIAVSAIPIEHREVHRKNHEMMGEAVQRKNLIQQALAYIAAAPKKIRNWLVETLHLDAAQGLASGIWGWLKAKASMVLSHIGLGGLAGAGLLAVSTDVGRKVLGVLFKPVLWLGRMVDKGLLWAAHAIGTSHTAKQKQSRLDKARNWVADRLTDVDTFLFGNGTDEPGIFKRAAIWTATTFGAHLRRDSFLMTALRMVGMVLTALKVDKIAMLLPWSPTGAQLTVQRIGYFISVAWSMLPDIGLLFDKVTGRNKPSAEGEAEEAAEAVAEATEAAETVAEVVSTTPPTTQGGNRTARRHANRKGSPPAKKSAAS